MIYHNSRNPNQCGKPWLLKHALFWLIVSVLILCQLQGAEVGCSERVNPAPRSYMSKAEAKTLAKLWSMGSPGRAYCEVEPTSSMVPVFDSCSVLLLEVVDPGDLHKNDIARYESTTYGNVTHRVVRVDTGSIVFEGDNCPRSDGSVSKSLVKYRVAGILYCREH